MRALLPSLVPRGKYIPYIIAQSLLILTCSYLAESYLSTPEGRAEADRAKAEGSKFYLQAKEVILRPKVAGGLVGALNVAVLGSVGYFSYKNWNKIWDPRIVLGVAAGLVGLSGVEG